MIFPAAQRGYGWKQDLQEALGREVAVQVERGVFGILAMFQYVSICFTCLVEFFFGPK